MVSLADLRSQNSKALARMAKESGIAGWHSMRKEELVKAISRVLRRRQRSNPIKTRLDSPRTNPKPKNGHPRTNGNGVKPKSRTDRPRVAPKTLMPSPLALKLQRENAEREQLKNLALVALERSENQGASKDRVILIVRDSHWLQVYWEVTDQTVARARKALEKGWRGARPVLRLYELRDDGGGVNEELTREIEIHGRVDTWYIDTVDPPKTYRVAIGYLSPAGRFFSIGRSNKVSTPLRSSNVAEDHWAAIALDYQAYFAMSGGYSGEKEYADLQDIFEEKLQRPIKPTNGEDLHFLADRSDFRFEVDAQLVVYGVTEPGAVVTVSGEPVRLQNDGTFSIRMELPDKRQVLPVVACSRDGAHQRTTVLAVERNTKVMDPISLEQDES